MSFPTVLQPGEGQSVQIKESVCTIKATGKDTHGHLGLFEFNMAPGAKGATPHIHKKMVEMFYVAAGTVEFLLEEKRTIASQGAFVLVPENTPHAFSNPGPMPATVLLLFCPNDSREEYFAGMAELTKNGREPTQEELSALMERFDQYLVPDPQEQ